ncbi:hypothetical protein FC19_GL001437 [Liquorilactobacillus aquaticus DSM 21051]|uniref:Phage protein n=1 Tax=Liquorilactobacillus aquaticus DSM 21051 TaxID=1423725 RepID=A0A0R2D252_9LACO|nr:hypothetical protein [Liquorilactobacillus aquaticus]KRM95956.1 hypothetical protein FC19_GL001437 [Liquorilactobacillus aquaticus DSM 21051]
MIIKINAERIGIKKEISVLPSFYLQTEATRVAKELNGLSIQSLKQSIADKESKKAKESENQKDTKAMTELEKLKANLADAEEAQKDINKEEDVGNELFAFLQQSLNLNEKQILKAKKTLPGFAELGEFVSYVITKIKNPQLNDSDINFKPVNGDKDPKKD